MAENPDYQIDISAHNRYAHREVQEKRLTFALAALAASGSMLHLSPAQIAKHAWNVAGAMILEGQARGVIVVPALEEVEATEVADTTETTTPAAKVEG